MRCAKSFRGTCLKTGYWDWNRCHSNERNIFLIKRDKKKVLQLAGQYQITNQKEEIICSFYFKALMVMESISTMHYTLPKVIPCIQQTHFRCERWLFETVVLLYLKSTPWPNLIYSRYPVSDFNQYYQKLTKL